MSVADLTPEELARRARLYGLSKTAEFIENEVAKETAKSREWATAPLDTPVGQMVPGKWYRVVVKPYKSWRGQRPARTLRRVRLEREATNYRLAYESRQTAMLIFSEVDVERIESFTEVE